jgi:hypothetical protein
MAEVLKSALSEPEKLDLDFAAETPKAAGKAVQPSP